VDEDAGRVDDRGRVEPRRPFVESGAEKRNVAEEVDEDEGSELASEAEMELRRIRAVRRLRHCTRDVFHRLLLRLIYEDEDPYVLDDEEDDSRKDSDAEEEERRPRLLE